MTWYLVPAGLRHAVDILLVSGAATVDDAIAIAIAVVYTVTPLVGNIAVARVVGGRVRADIGRDVCLSRSQMGEASQGRS